MTITQGSLRAFWKHRILWWFAVPAGTLVGLSTYISIAVQDYLPENPDISSLTSLFLDDRLGVAIGISLLVALCQSLIRGALVALFAHQMSEGASNQSRGILPWRSMFRGAHASLSFEAAYWFVLLGIGIIIIIPSLLAQRFNPSILPSVFELGFLLLITIGVYLYFTKELSCLYAVLGKAGFRSAGDLGFRLFRRHAFNTVLFFFYASLLALFFSLLVESISQALFTDIGYQSLPQSFLVAILLGFYYIFDQILRISFFRSIATTPKQPAVKNAVLEATETPSGVSPS